MGTPEIEHAATYLHPRKNTQRKSVSVDDSDVEEHRDVTEATLRFLEQHDVETERPKKRSECPQYRPCPFVSCQYHLYLDITKSGRIKFNFGELDPWELQSSCALDAVEENGSMTLKDTGNHMGLTRERIRQLQKRAVEFRVVSSEREPNGMNYKKHKTAHKKLGDKPRSIPIVLLSDDPEENLYGFRGWFAQPYDKPRPDKSQYGRLRCGAPYEGEDTKTAYFMEGGGEVPESHVESDDDGLYFETESGKRVDVEEREEIRASRRVSVKTYANKVKGDINNFVDPFDATCHKQCPIWQNGDCDVQHTLYFQVRIPGVDGLFVYRGSGVYAQRQLISSMKYLKEQTKVHPSDDGILAGLPLQLHLHFEQKGEEGYDTPHVKINDPGYVDLESSVKDELDRRRDLYEARFGSAPDEPIMKTGALSSMQSRDAQEAMATEATQAEDSLDEESSDVEVPDSVLRRFNQLGYPSRKRTLTVEQYTDNGELNVEELNKYLSQEIERKEDVSEYTEEDDAAGFFDDI